MFKKKKYYVKNYQKKIFKKFFLVIFNVIFLFLKHNRRNKTKRTHQFGPGKNNNDAICMHREKTELMGSVVVIILMNSFMSTSLSCEIICFMTINGMIV